MHQRWGGLRWTDWHPFTSARVAAEAPSEPGLYRIRAVGQDRLVYIGQTGGPLRSRLQSLRQNVAAPEVPYNDPHTAAPYLWLLCNLDRLVLEFSCAALTGDKPWRRANEDRLLWLHRLHLGCSTMANYGRFYPGWARSTNRWIGPKAAGRPGRRAVRLQLGTSHPDYTRSAPVVSGPGAILDAGFWSERFPLAATSARTLPEQPGIYTIFDAISGVPIYVGETSLFARILSRHQPRAWGVGEPFLAIWPLAADTPKFCRLELESDLLGWHFEREGKPPAWQYREAG
jgi:hypothetical protein